MVHGGASPRPACRRRAKDVGVRNDTGWENVRMTQGDKNSHMVLEIIFLI